MMMDIGILAPRLRDKWLGYLRQKRGAVAVEFALVAVPFFFIIFGLLEVCMIFIFSSIMEHAISDSSRLIRTGQAQDNAFTATEFRAAFCDETFGMLNCIDKLHVDVKQISGFGAADLSAPLDGDGNFDDSGFGFDPGDANEIVAVRIYYEWDLITPWISAPLANMSGNRHLIQENLVFRNEPFGD